MQQDDDGRAGRRPPYPVWGGSDALTKKGIEEIGEARQKLADETLTNQGAAARAPPRFGEVPASRCVVAYAQGVAEPVSASPGRYAP